MGFDKVSFIITIVLLCYSALGFLFILGTKIYGRIKAKKAIKEAHDEVSHIEVKKNEQK